MLTGVKLIYSKVDGNDNSGLVDDSVPLNLQSNATASSDAGGTYAIYATSNDKRIPLNRATDIDNYRVTVTKDDYIITLSTCTKSGEHRYLVHAKKVY